MTDSPPFEFLEHTADVRVRVWGQTLPRLFENAARAMFSVIAEMRNVRPAAETAVEVRGEDPVSLLVNWLAELLYRFGAEQALFCEFEVERLTDESLSARVRGETVDFDRHELLTEVKGVTYHEAKIEKQGDCWMAELLFDV